MARFKSEAVIRPFAFIPCYNCGLQIARLIQALPLSLIKQVQQFTIIDNDSSDNTIDSALHAIRERKLGAQFRVFRNQKNIGLGGSFKSAFTMARRGGFTHLMVLHGDGQAHHRDAARILTVGAQNPRVAAILGSRFADPSLLANYPLRRRLGNEFFNGLMSVLWREKISDIGSGLNLYKVHAFNENIIEALPDHIAFDLVLLVHILENEIPYQFLPINWRTADEKSSISEWKLGLQLMRDIVKLRIKSGRLPLHLTTPLRLADEIKV